jgi:hypothetical protein
VESSCPAGFRVAHRGSVLAGRGLRRSAARTVARARRGPPGTTGDRLVWHGRSASDVARDGPHPRRTGAALRGSREAATAGADCGASRARGRRGRRRLTAPPRDVPRGRPVHRRALKPATGPNPAALRVGRIHHWRRVAPRRTGAGSLLDPCVATFLRPASLRMRRWALGPSLARPRPTWGAAGCSCRLLNLPRAVTLSHQCWSPSWCSVPSAWPVPGARGAWTEPASPHSE